MLAIKVCLGIQQESLILIHFSQNAKNAETAKLQRKILKFAIENSLFLPLRLVFAQKLFLVNANFNMQIVEL